MNTRNASGTANREDNAAGEERSEGGAFALSGDRPIESRADDRLGRSPFAVAVAEQILSASPHDSYVVAVMGPWGAGKTSLLNMIAEVMRERDAVVLHFNPWIFSGIEGLVSHFFRELGAQLKELQTDRLSEVGGALERYAGLFVPVAGFIPVVGGLAKEIASGAKEFGGALAKGPSLNAQRKTVREKLTGLDTRIVVLIDDIDRLRHEEIREIVKLVRVTADFPNIVYVLAFDRLRVEAALGEDRETGRAYLEKIVQVSYDLPEAHAPDIYQLLLTEIDRAVANVPHGPFHQKDWADIFVRILRPLFTTPRDVRRYVNALPPIVRVLGAEVALEDVLAMEGIRIFEPEVFAKLADSIPLLTDAAGRYRRDDVDRKTMAALIGAGGANEPVLREFFTRLFPNCARHLGGPHYTAGFGKQWRRERRVADEGVLRFYLERRLPEGTAPAKAVTDAIAVLGDRAALTRVVEAIDDEHLESFLGRLEDYEDVFPPEAATSATGALLDQLGRLREGRRGMFDMGAGFALTRVVLRLLRRIEDESERTATITAVLPTVATLTAQTELLRLAEGHHLAPIDHINSWRSDIGRRVSDTAAESLATERDLGALIELAMEAHPNDEEVQGRLRAVLEHDGAFVRFLRSGLGEYISGEMGRVAFNVQHTLPWNALTRLIGEGRLLARVAEVQAAIDMDALDDRSKVAIQTAVKYSDGWRPPSHPAKPEDPPGGAGGAAEATPHTSTSDSENPADEGADSQEPG